MKSTQSPSHFFLFSGLSVYSNQLSFQPQSNPTIQHFFISLLAFLGTIHGYNTSPGPTRLLVPKQLYKLARRVQISPSPGPGASMSRQHAHSIKSALMRFSTTIQHFPSIHNKVYVLSDHSTQNLAHEMWIVLTTHKPEHTSTTQGR